MASAARPAHPLNQVIGYSELLQEDADGPEGEWLLSDLQRINVAARHLLELLVDNLEDTGSHPDANVAGSPPSVGVRRRLPEGAGRTERGIALVVVDDEMNRSMLARRLEREGHRVRLAHDGCQALDLLRDEVFDLVLLDIMMPGMDGFQVPAQVKADEALRLIPVIMLSALDDMESVVRCIEMGAEDYLQKPFDPVLLRARIGACLETKRLRDQEQAYLSALKREQDQSQRLLLNVLPPEIAERLKREEGIIADSFAEVTVLFADIVGFTGIAGRMSPVALVTTLNEIFSAVDRLAERHGLEKIKTIGHAYMAVAGLPTPVRITLRRLRRWRLTCSRMSGGSRPWAVDRSTCGLASTAVPSWPESSGSGSSPTISGGTP